MAEVQRHIRYLDRHAPKRQAAEREVAQVDLNGTHLGPHAAAGTETERQIVQLAARAGDASQRGASDEHAVEAARLDACPHLATAYLVADAALERLFGADPGGAVQERETEEGKANVAQTIRHGVSRLLAEVGALDVVVRKE